MCWPLGPSSKFKGMRRLRRKCRRKPEKVLRAYVVSGKASQTMFAKAAKSRLCTDAGAAIAQETQDDLALTQL